MKNLELYYNKYNNPAIDFEDFYKTDCTISEGKSECGTSLICLQYEFGSGITLSQEELKDILPILNRFYETGSIE
jgi:hypothetical protein